MPIDSVTYGAALKKSKEYTDSMIHRGILVAQVTNGGSFPTTRPDGSALQDEDYCTPLASSTFPFTIGSVTFENRFTQAIYFSGNWLANPGAIQETKETPLSNPTVEGITGLELTQAQLNTNIKTMKLDKATDVVSLEHAYIHKADGTQGLMQINTNANAGLAIVRRDLDKQINVPYIPVSDEDAASKQYVDTTAAPDNITLDRSAVDQKLEIKDAGVSAAKLATDSVETLKIKDLNVTTAKLADASVTAAKLATDSVETDKIKNDAVTIDKVSDSSISTAIPVTGAVDTKLATEKAVADFAEVADLNSFLYSNASEQFEITYKKPSGSTATKTVLASSITKGVVTQTAAQDLTNKTIDVDSNTVSNIEVDNFKTGVVDTANFYTADDTHLPSSKLVDTRINEVLGKMIKFVGYVSATAPAGGTLRAGNLWYESAITTMPTTFPIQVKTFDGTSWSSTTTAYTPDIMDLWSNLNNNHGYYWFGVTWNQIDFTIAADGVTIDLNLAGQLQIKDGGVTLPKFAARATTDEGKGYLIDSTGATVVANIKQYKRVTALTTETGNPYTIYILETPEATYAAGIYVWDAINGFVNYNGGGSSGPQFIGLVKNGDTFPVLRPDGTVLQLGDYVKPDSSSTFPFTIDSCTFTSVRDQATYLGYMNWQLNASPYQSTIDISVHDASTESLSGVSLFQNDINIENVTALKARLKASDIQVRENTKAYALGARVLFPEKYGYVLICTAPGTTAATKPAWPTTIASGTTTIGDGSLTWKIYDMMEGEDLLTVKRNTSYGSGARCLYPGKAGYLIICKTAGTTGTTVPAWPTTIESGVTELTDGTSVWTIYDMSAGDITAADVSLRKKSTAYAAGARVFYPGKYSYVLVCKTAGTSAETLPTWPTSITTGVTELADGTAVWTIYDMSLGLPQLKTFPTSVDTAPDCFQFVGTDTTHVKNGFYYKKAVAGTAPYRVFIPVLSESLYTKALPADGESKPLWMNYDCTNSSSFTITNTGGVYKAAKTGDTPEVVNPYLATLYVVSSSLFTVDYYCAMVPPLGASETLYQDKELQYSTTYYITTTSDTTSPYKVYIVGSPDRYPATVRQAATPSSTILDLLFKEMTPAEVAAGTETEARLISPMLLNLAIPDIGYRKSVTTYSVNDRVLYPGKTGYVLVCTTAGKTAAAMPAWPSGTISSGSTTLTDGTVTWTIYDSTLGGVPQLRTFPASADAAPESFQYIGSDATRVKNGFYYKREDAGAAPYKIVLTTGYRRYTKTLPADGETRQLYYNYDCTSVSTFQLSNTSGVYTVTDGVFVTEIVTPVSAVLYAVTSSALSATHYCGALPSESTTELLFIDKELTSHDNYLLTRSAIDQSFIVTNERGGVLGTATVKDAAPTITSLDLLFKEMTIAEAQAGIETERRLVSPAVLKAALPSAGVPQLSTFPTFSSTSPESFQYIGSDGTHEKYAFYKKSGTASYLCQSATAVGYVIQPDPTGRVQLYDDAECTTPRTGLWLEGDGAGSYSIFNEDTLSSESASVTPNGSYAKLYKTLTVSEIQTGTETEGALISAKVMHDVFPDVGLRQNTTSYSAGGRALYPGKSGYVLVCTTAGISGSTVPTWPTSVTSGTTTLTDGSVTWTIYDSTLGGVPQLSVFPASVDAAPASFQFIGSDGTHDKNEFYAKIDKSFFCESPSFSGYVKKLPTDRTPVQVYSDEACTTTQTLSLTLDTTYYFIWEPTGGMEPATVSGGGSITRLYKEMTTAEAQAGTDTERRLISPAVLKAAMPDSGVRRNSTAYSVNDRVTYPGKPGFVLICSTAGTTGANPPTWYQPTDPEETIIFRDGSVVWKMRDLTADASPEARQSSTSYSVGDRVRYPGKAGYVLVCTTAGMSYSSVPAWPSTIVSGTTTLTDREVVWTIYDQAQAVFQNPDGGSTTRTKAWVWGKRGSINTVNFVPSVKFVDTDSPNKDATSVFSVELHHSSASGKGSMIASLGDSCWMCDCSGDLIGKWRKQTNSSDLQAFYDGIFPVGFISYGPTAPGVPTGITATWTEDTTDNSRFLQVSSEAAGTQKGEQLPNIKGKFGVVSYSTGSPIVDYMDGAFSRNMLGNTASGLSFAGDLRGLAGVYFNAANSSGVYADGGAVRPLTTTIKKWKRTA